MLKRPFGKMPFQTQTSMVTGALLVMCPMGILVAFVSHLLLLGTALVMTRHHPVYSLAAVGYGSLTLLLGVKFLTWVRRRRKKRKSVELGESWEDEFEAP